MRVAIMDIGWEGLSAAAGDAERAALAGDRAAWNTLVARHDRRVVLALVAAGVRPAQARDIAQEAWLTLIRRADAKQLPHLQLPGLAVRQALYLAKTQGRRPQGEPLPEAEALVADAPDAFDHVLTAERLRAAQAVLRTCSDSAQRVFSLLYSQPHLSHAEVAQQVGLSVQRVRQIVCEVRKKLRPALGGTDD